MASHSVEERVILHVDLDAFYAQVEQRRLGLPPTVPLGVTQWGVLLAVNYVARPCGVKKGMTEVDAKRMCPELMCVEVEKVSITSFDSSLACGDDDGDHSKVSLRRYRKASLEVMKIIRKFIPESKFERVGMDEAYGDVTSSAVALLQQMSSGEISAELAKVPGHRATWDADGVEPESSALLAGAVLCGRIRAAVKAETGFILSGGISCSKTVSKIASAMNKPNHQTVVQRSESVDLILTQPIHKVPLLRGKLGRTVQDLVTSGAGHVEGTDITMKMVAKCLEHARTQRVLGVETYKWLQALCRGEDDSAIVPRLRPKSLIASKGLGEGVTTITELKKWLLLLGAEMVERMSEDLESFGRNPRSLVVHHSGPHNRKAIVGGWGFTGGCSRTIRMPSNKTAQSLAESAMTTILKLEHALPCTGLSLTATDFVEVATGKGSIARYCISRPSSTRETTGTGRVESFKREHPDDDSTEERKRLSQSSTTSAMEDDFTVRNWSCPFCTFLNEEVAFACEMCLNMKDAAPTPEYDQSVE